jgi:hypothetical protein
MSSAAVKLLPVAKTTKVLRTWRTSLVPSGRNSTNGRSVSWHSRSPLNKLPDIVERDDLRPEQHRADQPLLGLGLVRRHRDYRRALADPTIA